MAKKKSKLGQVFLVDKNIVSKMVRVADLPEDDWVVEVGPGRGILTEALLENGLNVIAFEIDRKLAHEVREKFRLLLNDRLFVFEEDYLKADVPSVFKELGVEKAHFMSNIPYYITTPILDKLVREREFYRSIHLTVQKEVAERIVARASSDAYGSLTIYLNYYFEPKIEFFISNTCFRPIPDVHSAFLRLMPRKQPPIELRDEKLFFRIMRGSFSMRRKKLRTVLRSMFGKMDWERVEELSGIDLDRRGETLDMDDFARLSNAIHALKSEGG